MTEPDPYEGLTENQKTTVRFMEQVGGLRLVAGPPPADSPLGRALALTAALQRDELSADECRDGIRAIMREGLTADELANL